MVDIHSHLLWNVDDGPKELNETIQIVKQAVKEGITKIISTSHFQHPLYSVDYYLVEEKIKTVQNLIEKANLPLKVYTGHEVRLSENILPLFQSKKIHSLANSRYLLLELPSNTVPYYTIDIIHKLLVGGITPIIAHPERNKAILEDPLRLELLIRSGALAQVTAGSVAGHFGRKVQKLAIHLIQANLIHTYGSDTHNLITRPFLFKKGLFTLEKKKLKDHVTLLLDNNNKVIENEPIMSFEPVRMKNSRWW